MNYFQKIILIIAIIILIISLIIIGFSIRNTKNNVWPPLLPSCPDYWVIDGSGNNTKCINVKDLGTCQPFSGNKHLTMDFNEAPYNGSNGTCAKYTWANNCNLAWDGINYGANNPCSTPDISSSSSSSSSSLLSSGNQYNNSFFGNGIISYNSLFPNRQNFS
jgi:hypothetical protein